MAREALSAAYDGESGVADPLLVRRHVAVCGGCQAFERGLDAMTASVVPAHEPAPDLVGRVLAGRPGSWQWSPGALVESVLRVAVVVCGVVGIAVAVTGSGGHGDHGAHAGHEAVAMTLAQCIGLVVAGVRPRLAAAYLPVVGLGGLLIAVSSVVDIDSGVVSLTHESDHLDLLVGCGLLAALAIAHGWPPGGWTVRRRHRRRLTPGPALRVVSRVVVQVGRTPGVGLRALAALALATGLALVAAPASAHAVLEASTPGPDAVLTTAPAQVGLRFDEAVTLLPTSVRVYAPDGSRADDGHVIHPGGESDRAAVGLRASDRGTYLVSWRVVSADSHPVSGAYSFSIGARSAAPKAAAEGDDSAVQIILGLTRFVSYAGTALLVGGLLFVVVTGDSTRTRRLAVQGAALLGVASVLGVLLKGPLDAGLGLGAIGRPGLLGEVLDTTYGRATLARVGLAALGAVLALGWARLSHPVAAACAGLLAVAVALSVALAGHSGTRPLTLVTDTLHVLAMSAWAGGLVAVAVDALPAGRTDAVRRFSTLALVSVALLVVTGVIQAWRQVGAWGALTATSYGQDLLTKIVLVALVVAFAVGSWTLARRASWVQLKQTIVFESIGLAAVLAVTSALTATQPAKDAWRPQVEENLHLLGDTVQFSAVSTGDRRAELHVYVYGKGSQPVDPPELTATIRLPGRDIGPLPVALRTAGPGHRVATVSVPVAGTWRLGITLRTTDVDQDSAYVDLPLR